MEDLASPRADRLGMLMETPWGGGARPFLSRLEAVEARLWPFRSQRKALSPRPWHAFEVHLALTMSELHERDAMANQQVGEGHHQLCLPYNISYVYI